MGLVAIILDNIVIDITLLPSDICYCKRKSKLNLSSKNLRFYK